MYIICQALGRRLACFQLKHKSTVYRYFTLKGYYERQLSISWIWSIIDPFLTLLSVLSYLWYSLFSSAVAHLTHSILLLWTMYQKYIQSYGHDSYQRCLGRVHLITITFCLSQCIFMACCVNVPLIKV